MYNKFGQFIDGKWQPSSNNETYDVINPATEEIIGQASKATPADVDKALKSAEKGFNVWRKFSPWDRSAIIRKTRKCKRTIFRRNWKNYNWTKKCFRPYSYCTPL